MPIIYPQTDITSKNLYRNNQIKFNKTQFIMKKITTLLMLLIIAISGSAKSTAYAPDARVGAGELMTGRNYMIFNTAYTPGTSFTNRWGAIYYNSTKSAISTYGGAVPETFTTDNQNYLFQLALNEPNVLYCVGGTKLIGSNFTFTPWEEATSGKGGAQSRNDDGTFTANDNISAANKVWLIHNGSQYWNGNNWNTVGDNCFTTWSNGHPYAIYTVKEVVTVTVTYKYCEEDGFELWEEDVEQAANSPVNVPASMQGGNMYSISTEGTIGEEDCEIYVKRTPNFTFDASVNFGNLKVKNDATTTETSAITEGQWYMLTQVRGGETPVYDTGAGNTLKRTSSAVSITQGTDPDTITQYLVRFFNTGTGDAKYIQFATGNFWSDMKSSASNATMFLVYPAAGSGYSGWAMNKTTDGTTYLDLVDNNGAGNTLSYWDSGQITSGGNNVWKLYPVDFIDPSAATSVELTYKIVDSNNNTLVENAGTVTAYVGEPLPTVPAAYMNDFVSYTYKVQVVNGGMVGYAQDNTVVPSQNATVIATATYNLPFELSADPADQGNAHYYYMTLREKYCFSQDATDDAIFNHPGYQYAFGGNPLTGISVYNLGLDQYMYITAEDDNYVVQYADSPFYFTIQPNNNQPNGFNLNYPGSNNYINLRNGKVSTWLSANANGEVGSCLVTYSEADYIKMKIDGLAAYFDVTNVVGALNSKDTAQLYQDYLALQANPTYTGYENFKANLDANLIPLTPGAYYIVQSAYPNYYAQQQKNKVWYYSASSSAVKWRDLDAYPDYQVFQVVDKGNGDNVFYNPMGDVYLTSTAGAVSSDISAAKAFTLTALGGGQFNIFLSGTTTPIHTAGHSNGAGTNGSLTNWNGSANSASSWYLIPQEIEEITLISPEGVADGEKVVQGYVCHKNAQMPTSVGVYTISEDLAGGARLDTIATGRVAAGQGYVISGKKGQIVPLLPVNGTVDAPAGNLLVAGDGTTVVERGYILAYKKGESDAKFWTIDRLTVPLDRAYLPEGTPTRGLENIFGGIGEDVTGINGVTTGTANGAIYDLQGRRVSNAVKGGVYIINGKKVIK